jgi:hypothetical protein
MPPARWFYPCPGKSSRFDPVEEAVDLPVQRFRLCGQPGGRTETIRGRLADSLAAAVTLPSLTDIAMSASSGSAEE